MKKALVMGAGIAASLIMATSTAMAGWGGFYQSFNTTNVMTAANATVTNLSAAGTNSGWPTNVYGVGTGQPINISQFDNIVLDVKGLIGTTNGTTGGIAIEVSLITSCAGQGGPQVIMGTNSYQASVTNIQYTDWPTATNSALAWLFTIPTGQTNTAFDFQTNIPSTSLGAAANWVGVYYMSVIGLGTNGSTLANSQNGFITNLQIGIASKSPVRPWSY